MTAPRAGIPFVVSGPSGAGKSSLLRNALAEDPHLRFSVSHTTRAPRPGEVNGVDYHFVDEPTFRRIAAEDGFLEWAEYQSNLYGTSRISLEGPTREGLDTVLEVEVKGAAQLRERLDGAVFVFIVPPSMEVLEKRLRGRGTDSEEVIRKRLDRALEEMESASDYDYIVENDSFEGAVAELVGIIRAARRQTRFHLDALRERFGLER